MEKLIYYPRFEVNNPDWLKFALLYIDSLRPIIPESGDNDLTDLYRRLLGETDLIDVRRPEYEDGVRAGLDALENVEKILQRPMRYLPVFHTINPIPAWKDVNQHKYTLYEEKYTSAWRGFCLKEKLAQPTHEGLLMHKDLAMIYMTILSQAIADAEGVSPITDHQGLDDFSMFIRRVPKYKTARIKTIQPMRQMTS